MKNVWKRSRRCKNDWGNQGWVEFFFCVRLKSVKYRKGSRCSINHSKVPNKSRIWAFNKKIIYANFACFKNNHQFFFWWRDVEKINLCPKKVKKNVDIHVDNFFSCSTTLIKPIEMIFMTSDSIQSFLSHFAQRLDSELRKKRIRQKNC